MEKTPSPESLASDKETTIPSLPGGASVDRDGIERGKWVSECFVVAWFERFTFEYNLRILYFSKLMCSKY